MSRIFLLVVVACCFLSFVSAKYNVFKRYDGVKNRPIMYAKKSVNHDIREYLTPIQIKMLNARKGKDTGDVMFDNNWSGFDGFQPKPYSSKRQLGDFEEVLASQVEPTEISYFVPMYILAGGVGLMSAITYFVFRNRKASHQNTELNSEIV